MKYIKKFEDIRLSDTPTVGGKNASLGQMVSQLGPQGITVPTGFAITAQAYRDYIAANNLEPKMQQLLASLDKNNLEQLNNIGAEIRALIAQATMPAELEQEIGAAYQELSKRYGVQELDVAVRSSATAEDLPNASFAGQQETYLNIHGHAQLITAVKNCMASLFTDRAIIYRIEKGFDHFKVALSVGVQKMIRSDKACAGVMFTLDTETGFKDVVMINAAYGLGESVVQGAVTPDEFVVHKPTLALGFKPIIKKALGDKAQKIVYTDDAQKPVTTVSVDEKLRNQFCLTDDEILSLARQGTIIENYYSELRNTWSPMDIEWAKDGDDNKLYIVQARPETIHATKTTTNAMEQYVIDTSTATVIAIGQSIGQKVASGVARVIESAAHINQVQEGDIIVTTMTDPDWVPAMKRAAGIITERGGRTCHAAIVSRELNIPAIVGVQGIMQKVKTGDNITIDCSGSKTGTIYQGLVPFTLNHIELKKLPELPVDLMVNIADPESAFGVAALPVAGVGLARLEFIISNTIKVHPMALMQPEKITDAAVKQQINNITAAYPDQKTFFVDSLAYGIGMIAAAFYPRRVIVRTSDFKSNEYRNLIGGAYFEVQEENPMIGFRGASRYTNERYAPAFALECAALKKVREEMGFTNITLMIPFVRTVGEGKQVLELMAQHGLTRSNDLKIIMMCEIPSNVLLVDEFSALFDGFSIGSNDLTQLTLGVDRDSEILAPLFDERDPAVKQLLALAVEGMKRNNKYSGICGQAPSDYPELAKFLIEHGISSISLNSDSVIPFLMNYKQ